MPREEWVEFSDWAKTTPDANQMTRPDSSFHSDSEPPADRPLETSVESSLLLSAILAWLGVSICLLLLQGHDLGGSIFCGVRAGCEAILASRYAVLAGIPLPWLGLAFYVTVLILLLATYGIAMGTLSMLLLEAVKWLTIAGVSFSASLMLIQFVILRGFCPLCTSSAIIAVGLLFLGNRCRRLADEGKFRGLSMGRDCAWRLRSHLRSAYSGWQQRLPGPASGGHGATGRY